MNTEEIIRMAREAGMEFVTTNSYSTRNKDVTHLYQNMYGIEKMEHFYNLAFEAGAAHEREACAKLVLDDAWALTFQTFGQYRSALVKAIRGEK